MAKTKRTRKMGPWESWPERGPGHKIKYNKSVSRVRVKLPRGGGPTDHRTDKVEDVVAKPKPKQKKINPWRFTEKQFNEFINQ